MDRRKFLHTGSLSGFGAIMASQAEKSNWIFPSPYLEEATISSLQEKMRKGAATSLSITRGYLQRIEAIDRQGPALKSVIEINPDALVIAAAMDKERKEGKIRGPLHGIPVMVKDNIDTADRMATTAGSLAMAGNIAKEDAYIISQLRRAGAVLLGKTNLSEWANFRASHSTSAWSSRGGQTRCPYLLDRNPSGSSSGSGAATAASLCTVSIGTETDGSIVSPASINGLVGIKPTVGLWSRSGIIPISATQDTAGPMARTVSDAAILLGALTGVDSRDLKTEESQGKSLRDYTSFLNKDGLRGKRIGIEKSHLKAPQALRLLLNDAIKTMQDQGAVIVEVELLKALEPAGRSEFVVLLYEFKDGVNRYLSQASANVHSLEEVIAFNNKQESRVMPFFKQETLIESQAKGDLHSQEYTEALKATLDSRQIIAGLMERHQLDALSGITCGPACCIDLVNGDYDNGPSFSSPAAISGFPHITVPMGLIHSLPAGLSFFATAYAEPKLIAMAYAYEQASLKRKAPEFRKTLPV